MKVIIAGSRSIHPSQEYIQACVDKSGFDITELVWGKAPGVDAAAYVWSLTKGIPDKPFPAPWEKSKKRAGGSRNFAMAIYADALIAITVPHGSPGTANMIWHMDAMGKPVHIVIYKGEGLEINLAENQGNSKRA